MASNVGQEEKELLTKAQFLSVYTGPSLQRMALFDIISSVLGVVKLCSLLSVVNRLLKSPVCKCHILYNSSDL